MTGCLPLPVHMATSSRAGPPDWHVYNPAATRRETRTAVAREVDRAIRVLDTVPVSRGSAPNPALALVEPHTTPMAGTCPGHVRAQRSVIHGGGMNVGFPVDMSIVHSELCT